MMSCAQSPGSGLRRFDEHAAFATQLAEEFRGLDAGVSPTTVLGVLKRAAPYIEVDLRIVSLVDLLFAWTKPQDWRGGQVPVVWPSNDVLSRKLGVSVRQVQKRLNQAQALGLITFRDSPNGCRGGRRGEDGTIVWAYGIVLAPVGTRFNELKDTAAAGAVADAAVTILQKRLAAARRKIRSMAQTAQDRALGHLRADEDLALALMATQQMRRVRDETLLTGCVEQIEGRARALAAALMAEIGTQHLASETSNSSCSDEHYDVHSTTTKHLQSAKADTGNGSAEKSRNQADVLSQPSAVEEDLEKHGVSLSFMAEVASDLWPELGFGRRDWGDLVATAERLSNQAGISAHAFHQAVRIMGQRGAAASVIATIQKHRRGEVHRPGAYLRGMTDKAYRGELNLGRTFHGLKDASRSVAMAGIADGSDPMPFGSLVAKVMSRRRLDR